MGLQHRLLFLPDNAEVVSNHLAFARHDGHITFFDAAGSIFTFQEDDEGMLRLAAVIISDPALGLALRLPLSYDAAHSWSSLPKHERIDHVVERA